jgi:murein DD-endopeptidase MepM/ murein hydrolase activator NlpD
MSMIPLASLTSGDASRSRDSSQDGLANAAQALEAHFLNRLLEQMTPATKSGVGGGMYQGMLNEKLAESMAEHSPLGLRDMIVRDIIRHEQGAREEQGLRSLRGFDKVSSTYGLRQHPVTGEHKFHHGWDLPAPPDSPVQPPTSGRVVFSGTRGGYGELVEVEHADGTHSLYAHLARRHVAVGDQVSPETVIGAVGSTGTSTGPHLHFELQRGGKSVDPSSWLTLLPHHSTVDVGLRNPYTKEPL